MRNKLSGQGKQSHDEKQYEGVRRGRTTIRTFLSVSKQAEPGPSIREYCAYIVPDINLSVMQVVGKL